MDARRMNSHTTMRRDALLAGPGLIGSGMKATWHVRGFFGEWDINFLNVLPFRLPGDRSLSASRRSTMVIGVFSNCRS